MKYLTNSEMRQWRRCRRQWYLATYRGLRRKGKDFNRPTGIGNRVHDALSVHYDPVNRKDPVEHLKETIARDIVAFPAYETDIRKEGDLTLAMIEGYVEWLAESGEDEGLEVVESERARTAPLIEGVTLMAKLDARVIQRKVGNQRLALEHKTVGDLSSPLPLLQIDTQLLTEHLVEYLALQQEGREAEAAQGVLYNMLRKCKRTASAKPPFYRRETVNHNAYELRNHWIKVVAVAQEILAAEEALRNGADHHAVAYNNPTRDCKWDCEFFHLCALLDDGSDPEPAFDDLFETRNPLERYDGLLAVNDG